MYPLIGGVVVLLSLLIYVLIRSGSPTTLKVAVGSASGESHRLMAVVAEVCEAPRIPIRLELVHTAGSAESLELLERGEVHLATVQADVPPPTEARMVSNLYPDMFQLLVRTDEAGQPVIGSVVDLAGHPISVPIEGGGQHDTFERLLTHYGMSLRDVTLVDIEPTELPKAFLEGTVDATFRVRPPHNAQILALIHTGRARLLPLDQGEALQLMQPAVHPATMPKGAYRGAPPSPPAPLKTVGVQRVLLAHESVDRGAIRALTEVLYTRRQALVRKLPLAAYIRPQDPQSPISLPLHLGARSWYDREKPSFFEERADYVALILTSLVLFSSWLWQLRLFWDRRRKNRADAYNQTLVRLIKRIRGCRTQSELTTVEMELSRILEEVVTALDVDRITPQSFQSFTFTYDIAIRALHHRTVALKQGD